MEFGLCDIQGNTFYSLAGRPFLGLRRGPHPASSGGGGPMTGLVFRENKFVSEPVLPFAALAMPHYTQASSCPVFPQIVTRASNEPSRSLKLHYHGVGLY